MGDTVSTKAGDRAAGMRLDVSKEENLTGEHGLSQQPPICPLFCFPRCSRIPTRKTFTP